MRRPPLCALLALTACAGPSWRQAPHDQRFQTAPAPRLHPRPPRHAGREWWPALEQTLARPLGQALSPAFWLRRATGGRPALDVNHFGQVLDSPWFENRLGRWPRGQSGEAPLRADAGPAPGRLWVLGGKVEGATPGLVVQDGAGARFLVKFDPPAFPGLASGAEVITSRILAAAGYHVPGNSALELELSRLALSPEARTKDEYGEEVPLDAPHLAEVLAHVNPFPDGRVRALFSRLLPDPIGPYDYRGLSSWDPNDRVPHERRRSLRGLWLFAAWLNHTDVRAANTLDVFVPGAGGLGFVQHYLLDFGDTLGAAGVRPKFPGEGYEGRVDWGQIAQGLFSAGLYYRYWLPLVRPPHRAVGLFEAEVFEPERWAPNLPNPAFDEATVHDTFWAASLIARFDDGLLARVVAEAGYTEPGAAPYLLAVLIQRRDKVLRHAFAPLLPLDEPELSGTRLALVDLAVDCGLERPRPLEWTVSHGDHLLATGTATTAQLELGPALAALAPAALAEDPFVHARFARDNAAVDVHLRVVERGPILVALERHPR